MEINKVGSFSNYVNNVKTLEGKKQPEDTKIFSEKVVEASNKTEDTTKIKGSRIDIVV